MLPYSSPPGSALLGDDTHSRVGCLHTNTHTCTHSHHQPHTPRTQGATTHPEQGDTIIIRWMHIHHLCVAVAVVDVVMWVVVAVMLGQWRRLLCHRSSVPQSPICARMRAPKGAACPENDSCPSIYSSTEGPLSLSLSKEGLPLLFMSPECIYIYMCVSVFTPPLCCM